MRNKLFILVSLFIMASMVLAACAPAAEPAPAPAEEVTAPVAPEAPAAPEWKSADPTTYVSAKFGDPETLDPALCYETAGGQIIQNTHDSLIFYNRENPNEFIPQLALEVPSAENGLISADGLTYTFNIRTGVKFHDGTEMTPEDVAYSFQRAVLQGNTASPVWMFMEPFFGIGYSDIAEIVGERVAAAWEASLDGVVGAVDLTALTEAAGALPAAPEATEAPAAEEAPVETAAPVAEEVVPVSPEQEAVNAIVKQLVVDAAAAHTAVSGFALTVPDDIDLSGFDVAAFLAAADDAAKQAALKTFAMDTVSGLEGADVGAYIDSPEAVAGADPEVLLSVAADVQKAIVADNAAGTVVFTLAQPFAPFLPTIANSWGSATSKAWISANGGWDGDPATWQNFYGKSSEQINETPIGVSENGTGPFKLDHWTPGEEIVLVANEDYWKTEPSWEGGPSGPPAIKTVIIKAIDEFSTRFAMLEAGDAELSHSRFHGGLFADGYPCGR